MTETAATEAITTSNDTLLHAEEVRLYFRVLCHAVA